MNLDGSDFQTTAADIVAFPNVDAGGGLLSGDLMSGGIANSTIGLTGTPATTQVVEALGAAEGSPTNGASHHGADHDGSAAELTKTRIRELIIRGEFTLHPPPPTLNAPCWEKFCLVRRNDTGEYLSFAACKFCQKVYRYRGKDNNTSSMNTHRCKLNNIDDPDGINLALLAGAAPTLTYEMRQALLKSCVNFICRDDRPLNMVADNVFLELLQTAVTLGSKYGQFNIREVMNPPGPDASNSTLLFAPNTNLGGN
ncbi:hypothetical protein IWQ60_008738 [Tieghemiomyces parasiticus]|uniref:BED-type domain-containing protein n=1 Tax=Tieghemiomyces parasiticus TaxID=78921 RepID=A0A9W7ZYX6_9FUNG|nr:hypothetical protein IWQ60_008738 [Tieghemiomyces parasiticus]